MLRWPGKRLTVRCVGQGACQSIESGFALAQVMALWPNADSASAFQFFQDIRKPRTDKITQTSYETGKMASADIPESQWAQAFSPEVVHERMRWVMEYDLLADLSVKLAAVNAASSHSDSEFASSAKERKLTPEFQARL